jgi:peptide deformylase
MLHIVTYPDPFLRQKAQPIDVIDEQIRRWAEEMTGIMYEKDGVGLAASQVGIPKRIMVIDPGDGLQTYFNPEIVKTGKEEETLEEGCLSLPGIHVDIARPVQIVVKVLDPQGKSFEIEAEGLYARVFQHEIDHLNGILIIDHLSSIQRTLLRSKLRKLEKR